MYLTTTTTIMAPSLCRINITNNVLDITFSNLSYSIKWNTLTYTLATENCSYKAKLHMIFYLFVIYILLLYVFVITHLCFHTYFYFYFLQSPTSMCVTLEQMKRGGSMSFDDVFRMEYRMSQKFMVIMSFVLNFVEL